MRTSHFRYSPSERWSTLKFLFANFCTQPIRPLCRIFTSVYLTTYVPWICKLVCLVNRHRVLLFLTLLVEGQSTYKLISVGVWPSFSLFERLSDITFLLNKLIGHILLMHVGVFEPTPPWCIRSCIFIWLRSGYYLVWIIVTLFSLEMVNYNFHKWQQLTM